MNVRHFLKCEVCESVTLVRTQIGWLEQHPIRVHCGTCGILISGTAFLNQGEGSSRFEFKNAKVINEMRPDYYIEASGELITEKLQTYTAKEDIPLLIPSFFNSLWSMSNEGFTDFKSRTIGFINSCKNDWSIVRRIIELWLSGNIQYLEREVGKYLPKKQFPMNNELEYLRGVHQLYILFFYSILDKNFFESTTKFIWKEIDQLSKNNTVELYNLAKYFNEQGILHLYDEKIFVILNQFVEKFQYLIPVFGLQFYQKKDNNLNLNKGITTTSFEDLKQFYLDSYEVAGEMTQLIVAYNNLRYRNNYQEMVLKRKDVQTLFDFNNKLKSKAIRIGYVDGNEVFDKLSFPHLDNKLRNAIGHNSCKYDGANQIITYYPSGNEDPDDKNEIFLLDFAQKCWDIFQSINNLSELVYQTHKIYYISKGYKPIHSLAFGFRPKLQKVESNELCPCGSGKKYKKCCGI